MWSALVVMAIALFWPKLCRLSFSCDKIPLIFWESDRESLRSSGAESSEVVLSELLPQLAASRARGISRQSARI